MKKQKRDLTELEGAALIEIRKRGAATPYQVRKAFKDSPSTEWSGSAGAVYPALRRLHEGGDLIAKEVAGGRGAVRYSLSAAGERALAGWLANIDRAIGPGYDPFRVRAAGWQFLSAKEQRQIAKQAAAAAARRIAELERRIPEEVPVQRPAMTLELELQRSRLAWLRAQED